MNEFNNGFISGAANPWVFLGGSAANAAMAAVDVATGNVDGVTALFVVFTVLWALMARAVWKLKEKRSANNTNDTQ